MTPYEAYREYLALKSHFSNKSYDYFKYNGKVKNATIDSYEKRRDKLFFMKLAKHRDPINFLVANFVENDKMWIGNIAYNEEAEKKYFNWLKKNQSLTYVFTNDISNLDENFDSNFLVEQNNHPKILKLYLSGEISIETLVILTDLVRCISYWNKNMSDDPIWNDVLLKIQKYKPFIKYDKEKMKKIVVDKF
jgi:hypothetical protein